MVTPTGEAITKALHKLGFEDSGEGCYFRDRGN